MGCARIGDRNTRGEIGDHRNGQRDPAPIIQSTRLAVCAISGSVNLRISLIIDARMNDHARARRQV
jgi:hypothetical protein